MNNIMSAMTGANMGNKLMDRFFRKVDGVVWDLMTGRVGVRSAEGIVTIEGKGDDAQIVVNMFEQFGMEVPAFAQSTPLAAVNVGDLIYGTNKILGWVVEVKDSSTVKDPADPTAPATTGVKRFKIMTPNGTMSTWTPPKMSMLGFDSGVMVLRSLMNMLPGGAGGLGQMQSMLMPMMMMGGDMMDMDSMMPMILMSQVGTGDGSANPMGAGAFAQMMPMMMMMQMMKGGGNGGQGGSGFFPKRNNHN